MSHTARSTLNTCERIDFRNRTWTALPNMREAKECFNPCLFNANVYVCGYGSRLVEILSVQTSTWLPFSYTLPENSDCCLYAHTNCIVVHSYQYISRLAVGRTGQLMQGSMVQAQQGGRKYSNSQPVLDAAHIRFFVIQKEQCLCFHMETGLLVQGYKFGS